MLYDYRGYCSIGEIVRRVVKFTAAMLSLLSIAQAKDLKAVPDFSVHWQPYAAWQISFIGRINRDHPFSLRDLTQSKNASSVIKFKAKNSASTFSVSYPQIQEYESFSDKRDVSTFLDNWQQFNDNHFIPKDLIPYVGIRMNYKLSTQFSFFNDITMQSIVYGFRYNY